jgi:hypothetical protein
MLNFSEIFTFTDQQETCSKCGCRTEIIFDLSHSTNSTQVHKCLSTCCQFEFILQKDIIK